METTYVTEGVFNEVRRIVIFEIREKNEMRYAIDLSTILDLPISIHAGSIELLSEMPDRERLLTIQKAKINMLIPGAEVVYNIGECADAIVVSNYIACNLLTSHERNGIKILAPRKEHQFDLWSAGTEKAPAPRKFLVPIGRDKISLRALDCALGIAKKTGASIVLYHTTRPKKGCESADWECHMNEIAKELIAAAVEKCETMDIPYEKDITSVGPKRIAYGISVAAYAHKCNLVVIGIAPDVVFGSHSLQTQHYCGIPTLIVE